MKKIAFLLIMILLFIAACSKKAERKSLYTPLEYSESGIRVNCQNDSILFINSNLSFFNVVLGDSLHNEWDSKAKDAGMHIGEKFYVYSKGIEIEQKYKAYIPSKELDVEIYTFHDYVLRIEAKKGKRDDGLFGAYLTKYGEENANGIYNKGREFDRLTWEYKNQIVSITVSNDGTDIFYKDKDVENLQNEYLKQIIEDNISEDRKINESIKENI